jgi:hypothetical protein
MSHHVKRLILLLLILSVLFGPWVLSQTNQLVTIKVSRSLQGTVEIEIRPTSLSIPMGGTVTFENASSSISSVVVFNPFVDLNREIQPGAQYTHPFRTAGEFLITVQAQSASDILRVRVTSGAVTPPGGGRPALHMAEILMEPVSGEQLVALANLGKGTANLIGWHLCLHPACPRLPDMSIAPQSWVIIHLGVSGTQSVTDVYVPLPRLNRPGDELALYNSNRFDDPRSMVDYVRWGSGRAPGRLNVAVSAGLWTGNESVDVSRLLRGQVIRYDGFGRRASDYSVSAPTMVSSAGR